MTRSARLYLEDILQAIDLIQCYTAGIEFEDFEADSQKQDAVIRRFEIIGEAVKALPAELKEGHPEVP